MAYFFLGIFTWAFACCIFLRRWANLVAGFRGAWRWFLDMLVVLRPNSNVDGQESVEWITAANSYFLVWWATAGVTLAGQAEHGVDGLETG